jgi:hypothetical protein
MEKGYVYVDSYKGSVCVSGCSVSDGDLNLALCSSIGRSSFLGDLVMLFLMF